jgi:hypothetical protein
MALMVKGTQNPTAKDAFVDETDFYLKKLFDVIDQWIQFLNSLDDGVYSMVQDYHKHNAKGGVFINGEYFPGNKKALIEVLKREKESKFITIQKGGRKDVEAKFLELKKGLDKPYDEIVIAMHGVHDTDTGIPTERSVLLGESLSIEERDKLFSHYKELSGSANLVILSCYRTWRKNTDPKKKDMDPKDTIELITAWLPEEGVDYNWQSNCKIAFTTLRIAKTVGKVVKMGAIAHEK